MTLSWDAWPVFQGTPSLHSASMAAALLALAGTLFSDSGHAQSQRANGAEFGRNQRLLQDLRAEPAPLPVPAQRSDQTPAELQAGAKARAASKPSVAAAPVQCGLGLHHEWVGHAADATFTPAYCEWPTGSWTLGIDTDGYVREAGYGGVRGLADVNLLASYKLISKEGGLAFGVGVTVPSHTDAGSAKSSQSGLLSLALAPWGSAQPSVSYDVVRNGDPQQEGGRSTQRLIATLIYPWSAGVKSRIDIRYRKPSSALGTTSVALTHSMDMIPSLGLKAAGGTVRTREGWANSLTLLIEHEF